MDSGVGGTAMTAINAAVTVVILAFVLVRQFVPRPVRARRLIWVVVLLVFGLLPPGPAAATPTGIALLVASLAVSAALAMPRARSMRLWLDEHGTPWRRGNARTLLWWLTAIAVRIGFAAGGQLAFGEPERAGSLWLGLAMTLGVQQLVLAKRVRALGSPAGTAEPSGIRSPGDALARVRR
ncbi:hypothetical protein [Actinocatenispora sera]|nr:hypothetical protein [Actinocatenispora sera]